MKNANILKSGVMSLVVLLGMNAPVQAEDGVQLQTNQNLQLNTQQRMGPEVPGSSGTPKQLQHKKMHQHKFEKELQKAEKGNRGSQMGSGMNAGQRSINRASSAGSGNMNRSGGGKH